jgi:NADPH2:quinone reductase
VSGTGRRIVFRRTGGPEVLEIETFTPAAPGPGEVLVRHRAAGVNYIDTYHRTGLYPLPLPAGLGSEAAGEVTATGDGVTGFAPGQRVAWFAAGPGGYATHRLVPADRLVALPDPVDATTAAAALLKGCTVEMLVERIGRVQAGDTVLVHAAAGGVGSLAVQWLKAIGARVVAHAGTPEKAALAAAHGAAVALSCPMEDLPAAVRAATDGAGVSLVLDGVGAASWDASLASVARRGMIVSFGNASGPVPPVPVLTLARAGSVFLTRPTLFDYVVTPAEMRAAADRLFAMLANGSVKVPIGLTLPLHQAAEAHRRLESRATTGSIVLTC